MITAMQMGKIRVANQLVAAKEELDKCRSSIIFNNGQHLVIDRLSREISELLKEVIPNEPI